MGILCFLEKKCHRISEISFLPSLKAKLLFPVCDGIPCIWDHLGGSFKTVMTSVTTLYSEVNLVLSILSPQRQVILQYIQQETFSPVHNA